MGSNSSTTTSFGGTENFWSPYPDDRRTQPSYFRDLIIYKCQLAELAWEASPLFGLSESNAPFPDYDTTKAMYNKLLAWNTGVVQGFILSKSPLPSVVFLE